MTIQAPEGFLTLSDDVQAKLGVSETDIRNVIEKAIKGWAKKDVLVTPKSALIPPDGRYLMTTLSTSDDPQMTVVKSVMVSPRNPDRGLPAIDGVLLVSDSETGALKAVMQAGWVTAVRTAGLSAVVAQRLANPESKEIAFIGAGVQARSHLAAFCDLFPIEHIRILSRGTANIEKLQAAADELGITSELAENAEAALTGADLVVSSITLAFDTKPFLDASWLKPGAFAAVTDASVPWFPESLSAFQTICIDDMEQEQSTANPMVPLDLVSADLPKMFGSENDLRFDPDKRAAFIFRGVAVGDFAVATLAYEKAVQAGAGQIINW